MRRILYAILSISLLIAGCGPSNSSKPPSTGYTPTPRASDIKTVYLDIGLPKEISLRVDPTSAKGEVIVTKVMSWLHAAKRSGSTVINESWSAQQDENTLTIVLRNGKALTIASDLSTNDSFMYVPSSTEILVGSSGLSQLEPYYDPSLAKWLWSGWRQDLTPHPAVGMLISRHQAIFYATNVALWISKSNPTVVQATMETAKAAGNEIGRDVVSLIMSDQTMVWLVLFQGPYAACAIPGCKTLPHEIYWVAVDAKTGQVYSDGIVTQVPPEAEREWNAGPP